MKIMLSALEQQRRVLEKIIKDNVSMTYNLMSYYYIKKKPREAEIIKSRSTEIMIDSGAHSFQGGVKVDFDSYTKEYAEWIKVFDSPKVVGYFEMDVDNIIGYEKVLELRKILEKASDKIIPVWHKNRGFNDYVEMCKKYKGKIIAISGGKHDIDNRQFLSFLKIARQNNCKMHALGMTSTKVLKSVPFDYTDSSSWIQEIKYGKMPKFTNGDIRREQIPRIATRGENEATCKYLSYREYQKMQEYYHNLWRRECKD